MTSAWTPSPLSKKQGSACAQAVFLVWAKRQKIVLALYGRLRSERAYAHSGYLYLRMLTIWTSLSEHPESFPVNALVPIPGTPLEENEVCRLLPAPPKLLTPVLQPVNHQTLLRTIATARVVLPSTIIRLAAGRQTLNENEQAMCFMAGANAVFTGEQMLTTPCSPWDEVGQSISLLHDIYIEGSPV